MNNQTKMLILGVLLAGYVAVTGYKIYLQSKEKNK